jgi:hypothetical protein
VNKIPQPAISEEVLDEARMRYDAERFSRMTPYPEVRTQLNADACHDVAVDMGLDYLELAEALGAPYRP